MQYDTDPLLQEMTLGRALTFKILLPQVNDLNVSRNSVRLRSSTWVVNQMMLLMKLIKAKEEQWVSIKNIKLKVFPHIVH